MAMCVEDRISNFPDHIRCHILSFLPIKAAVRTSIISTKWRYLFASISTIEFDRYLLRGLTHRNVDSFKNFVDRLLKLPDQVSLDCFRLRDGISCNDGDHDFDVSSWICAALCRGVKEIDLELHNLGDVPPVLFTCHSLVTLRLDARGCKIEVPSQVCLGNLKTVQLIHWNARELHIQIPSLKSLVLHFIARQDRDLNYAVVIDVPNLVYFRYNAAIVECYSHMKSLEKADICIYGFHSNLSIDATHLIQGICNVRYLSLNIHEVISGTSRLPIFHNLIEFKFCGRETSLVQFLHCASNLKTLIIKFLDFERTRWKALSIEVPSCLSFHLKEIEFSCFDTHMIEMVNYFLDNAMVLEKLIISMDLLTLIQKAEAATNY
uniref:F-box domain-containing protein n=1 Tax=Gossypium raimondii TaxID=29730 RepID=A0A0D2RDR0_GOSRA|nr:hypothetical protein B456_005G010800 [Gossypium raimondii]